MNNVAYTIYFDGSSKPNPGIMTSAYIIKDDDEKQIFSETVNGGDGTSNLAEYIGLYHGVKKASELGCKHIKIIGDSELIIRQVLGKCKCKKSTLLYYRDKIKILLLTKFFTWEMVHVLRKYNKEADKLTR